MGDPSKIKSLDSDRPTEFSVEIKHYNPNLDEENQHQTKATSAFKIDPTRRTITIMPTGEQRVVTKSVYSTAQIEISPTFDVKTDEYSGTIFTQRTPTIASTKP